jgi:hypothetical protein
MPLGGRVAVVMLQALVADQRLGGPPSRQHAAAGLHPPRHTALCNDCAPAVRLPVAAPAAPCPQRCPRWRSCSGSC